MARDGGRAGSNKPPGQRQLRVGEEIRHVLAEIFTRGEVRDPALAETPLTVGEVRMSPDLRHATVFVTPLGREMDPDLLEGLRRSAPYLSGRVARLVRLKFAPKLHFRADTLFAEAAHIDELLRDAMSHVADESGEAEPSADRDRDDGAA